MRQVQDILVVDYNGPQGSVELQMCESADVSRTKSRSRVKTMNRTRRALAIQSGTEEVGVSLTIVPELVNPEVDWRKAWDKDEVFTLVIEKGLNGRREQILDCMVESVNDSYSESGEARESVEVIGLRALPEG